MSHPFGDLVSQHLHRKHGLSQAKLAAGILQAPTIISGMCKGRRLTGPQARERVVAIIGWLQQQGVLSTRPEATALLSVAGMAPLQAHQPDEAALLRLLTDSPIPGGRAARPKATTPIADQGAHPPGHQRAPALPAPITPFVGRVTELRALTTLLADPTVRLLTVLGPGGIGKTRLALEVAMTHRERFGHGVYFVALAAVDTVYAITARIAAALNFAFYQEGSPHQQLCDYLRHKHLLLVLDNFEHLIEVAPPAAAPELSSVTLLLDLLQAAPQLQLLVTSRVHLNVQGEQLYILDGLECPPAQQAALAAARQNSAVDLFVQSARRVQAGFDLTADNLTTIVQICQAVQGMPLAILLAAAWASMLTPAEILAELQTNSAAQPSLDFLATDWRDLPARQRSLRTVFDHSWRLLTQAEQAVFAQLAIFHQGFTQQAAMQIVAENDEMTAHDQAQSSFRTSPSPIQQVLRSLLNKSLIRYRMDTQGGGRYTLHELARQYATARLAQLGALRTAVGERHSHYYAALLTAQVGRLQGVEQQAALALIEGELENIRAAWRWAIDHTQVAQLTDAMHSLGIFYIRRNRCQEGEAVYRSAVGHLQVLAQPTPASQRVLAQVMAWQSVFCRLLGQWPESGHWLQEALAIVAQADWPPAVQQAVYAFIFLQVGRLYEVQMELTKGEAIYHQALAAYQALDDPWGEANARFGLGSIAYRAGNYQQAHTHYLASLARYRQLGDYNGSANTLERLGYILRDQGQLEEAQHLTAESISLHETLGDRSAIAHGQLALGWLYFYLGRFQEAHRVVEKSAATFADLGVVAPLIAPTAILALINLELGHYSAARAQAEALLSHSRSTAHRLELAYSLLLLAYLALVETRYADADQLAAESAARFQILQDQERLALAMACQGYAARSLGDTPAAWRHFALVLRSAVTNHSLLSLTFGLPGLALLLADQGNTEQAGALYAQLAPLGYIANSRLHWDLAGAQLAAITATLPTTREPTAAAEWQDQEGLWATAAAIAARLAELAATDLFS